MSEKLFIDIGFTNPGDVIGVHDKTHQSILLEDKVGLTLPEIDGKTSQIIEKRIILGGSYGQLQHFSNEIRHERTAAAPLRFEVPGARNGQVVGEIEIRVPLLPAIQDSGAKSGRSPAPAIVVDLFCASAKF